MATKFTRRSAQERAHKAFERLEPGPESLRPTLSQRLTLIYLGIAVFSIVLLATYILGLIPGQPWAGEEETAATVVRKEVRELPDGDQQHVLVLQLHAPEGRKLPNEGKAEIATDPQSWESVGRGEELRVAYQRRKDESTFRVLNVTKRNGAPGGLATN